MLSFYFNIYRSPADRAQTLKAWLILILDLRRFSDFSCLTETTAAMYKSMFSRPSNEQPLKSKIGDTMKIIPKQYNTKCVKTKK